MRPLHEKDHPADNVAKRMADALAGIADVAAVYTSRREILVKAIPRVDLTWMSSEIESRLSAFGHRADILSIKPSLVVRLRSREITRPEPFPWTNIILFGLTILTTLLTGALWEGVDWVSNPEMIFADPLKVLSGGLPFSISLLAILIFHEFGHFFTARMHGVNVSLPYFIPAPPLFTIIGTFGAFIKSRSAFINKRQLLDVGAAGPLSGLIVAIVVLVIGINSSTVQPMTEEISGMFFGESLLFSLIAYLVKGPISNHQVLVIDSIGFAGWVGLLVTMFNLLPIGQLDGGHISYALFGKRQKIIANLFLLILVMLSFYWPGWALWLILAFILKPAHPPTIMDEIPLGAGRKLIAFLSFVAFIVCFIPVPFYMN